MFLTMINTLKRRSGIPAELFYTYWVNAHAAQIAARLPGIHDLWLHELSYEAGLLWPQVPGIERVLPEEDRFHGVPEPTFESEADVQRFLAAMAPLMDDEANIFEETISYQSLGEHSRTLADRTDAAGGDRGLLKFLLFWMARKDVSVEAFRQFAADELAPRYAADEHVLKVRLHLLEPYDDEAVVLDARGISHAKPAEKQYQGTCEIVFRDALGLSAFIRSDAWTDTLVQQQAHFRACHAFGVRVTHTLRRDGELTFAGLRTPLIADLIERVGALNQLDPAVADLVRAHTTVSPKRRATR